LDLLVGGGFSSWLLELLISKFEKNNKLESELELKLRTSLQLKLEPAPKPG
jgi:hypothetical protein